MCGLLHHYLDMVIILKEPVRSHPPTLSTDDEKEENSKDNLKREVAIVEKISKNFKCRNDCGCLSGLI